MPISLNFLPGYILGVFASSYSVNFSVKSIVLESSNSVKLELIPCDCVSSLNFYPGREIVIFNPDDNKHCCFDVLSVSNFLDDYGDILFSIWVRPLFSDFVIERHDIYE